EVVVELLHGRVLREAADERASRAASRSRRWWEAPARTRWMRSREQKASRSSCCTSVGNGSPRGRVRPAAARRSPSARPFGAFQKALTWGSSGLARIVSQRAARWVAPVRAPGRTPESPPSALLGLVLQNSTQSCIRGLRVVGTQSL